MPDQTDLTGYLQQLGLQPQQPDQTDSQISGFTSANTVGQPSLEDALAQHAASPAGQKKATFGDHVKAFIRDFAQNAGQSFIAQTNPALFQQQQENARLAAQMQQAQLNRSTLSAGEQAQLQNDQGAQIWKMLSGGATQLPQGQHGDFDFAGRSYNMPQAQPEELHNIATDSPIGQMLGIDAPLNNVPQDAYLKLVEALGPKLKTAQDKASLQAAHTQTVDKFFPMAQDALQQRFAGSQDPMAPAMLRSYQIRLQLAHDTDIDNGDHKATDEVLKNIQAETPYEKAKVALDNRNAEAQTRAALRQDTAGDRSFQFSQNELNKQGEPIQKGLTSISNLRDLVNARTPAADALIAPKLISTEAGGFGSGVRVTGAEIKSQIGGRSAWENLLATSQHYATNPKDALLYTPSQRDQISKIIDLHEAKLKAQSDALNKGFGDLAASNDPMAHRRIVDRTRKALLDVQNPPNPGAVVDSLVSKYGNR
jgi:hypothetical protein